MWKRLAKIKIVIKILQWRGGGGDGSTDSNNYELFD